MPEIDLDFLARQIQRLIDGVALVRDEQRVQGGMIMRLDRAVASLSEQVQVVHSQIGRIHDRLHNIEDAQPRSVLPNFEAYQRTP